jgi:TonB family protein
LSADPHVFKNAAPPGRLFRCGAQRLTKLVALLFATSGALWANDVVTHAVLKRHVEPVYPKAEQDAYHEGTVWVNVRIGPSGSVEDVRVETSSGFPALDASTVAAAKQWKFSPARDAKGRKIEGHAKMKANFAMPPVPGGIMNTRCSDLTKQVAAARFVDPDVALPMVRIFAATTDMLAKMATDKSLEARQRAVEMLPRTYEFVESRCAASPAAVYGMVLGQAMQDVLAELNAVRSASGP